MIKNIFLILLLTLINGCSYLSNKFELFAEKKQVQPSLILETNKRNYCATNSKIEYISEDNSLLKYYNALNPTLFENNQFTFIQKAVMLSLIEMSRRPDEASPYARLQVYLRLKGKNYYYDFRPKRLEDDTKMPSLKGLDYLVKKFLPKQTLTNIASQLDAIVPINMSVSSEFENFLKDNKIALLKNETLTTKFFKGDEPLTKYETFERVSYKSLILQYLSPLYSNDSDYEFTKNALEEIQMPKEKYRARCNYDISKEQTLRDELLLSDLKKSHTIGLQDGDNFFLSVSSATLSRPFKTTPKMSYFMKVQPSSFPLPICELKGASQDIVLFSSNGRNPVQHLQHLISYDIDQIDSSYSLNELLNFSRHLFLTNPDRILYESKRGRKAQLDFFLAMNFPIYHVEDLGNIFGHASFNSENKQENSIHIDDRSSARLWCK
jgi:hypothetical protein